MGKVWILRDWKLNASQKASSHGKVSVQSAVKCSLSGEAHYPLTTQKGANGLGSLYRCYILFSPVNELDLYTAATGLWHS